jgi:serine/threonine protein kinase
MSTAWAALIMTEPEIRYAAGALVARKYRVDGVVGAGGMGVVYKVTHERLGKVYAMKTLHQSLASREDFVARFFNEAKIHAKIDSAEDADVNRQGHKNIARIYDCDSAEDGTPFYVMEFLHGASLRKILWYGESRRFDIRRSLDIAISVFDALAYAHRKGVIHRDIKPDNIFIHTIGPFSEVKIVDFGIARILSSPAGTGERFLGTIAYSPREHLLGKPPTPKIDVYAATQVLYLMLVGRTPFAALRTERALGQALLSNTPPVAPLLTTFGEFPEFLASIVASGLSHNPDERPEAHVMARHLRGVKDELGFGNPIDVNATIEELSTAVHTVVGEEGAPDPSSTDKERDRQAIGIAATTPAKDGDTRPEGRPVRKPDVSPAPPSASPGEARAPVAFAHHGATAVSEVVPRHPPTAPSAGDTAPPRSWEPPRSAPEIDHDARTEAGIERALVVESHAVTDTAPMVDRPATPKAALRAPAAGAPSGDAWAARGFVDAQAGTAARKPMNDTEPLPIDFMAMLEKRHPSAAPNAVPATSTISTPEAAVRPAPALRSHVPLRDILMAAGTILAIVFGVLSVTFIFFSRSEASKHVAVPASQVAPLASVAPSAVLPVAEPAAVVPTAASFVAEPVPEVKPAPVKRVDAIRPTPSAKSSNAELLEWKPPPFASAQPAAPLPRKKLPASGL